MIAFFEVISTSAPHIYRSALPLSPQNSVVQKLYKQYAHPLVRVVQGFLISWGPIVASLNIGNHRRPIWSPCNRFIITYSNGSASILDAVTLKKLSTIDIGYSSCFCLTPDSNFLVTYGDHKLANWDLQTGCQIGTISPELDRYPWSHDSFTYSMDGKLLAALYDFKDDDNSPFIITYNLLFMTHVHAGPYYLPRGIMNLIWTHREHLQFATRKSGYITTWEIEFTLMGPPVEVSSLKVPTEIDGKEINDEVDFLFLPIVSRIAFSLQDAVFIWDAQATKFLLKSGPMSTPGFTYDYDKDFIRAKSFSSSGHIFACMAVDDCVRVWKESPTGYMLHQQFTLHGAVNKDYCPFKLCVSPNGESIIGYHSGKVNLWHTRDQITSISNVSTQGNSTEHFLLAFSPDEVLAAFVQGKGDTVTVVNLQSSDSQLTINVGIKVQGLAVTESAIVTASQEEVVVWNILGGNCSLDIEGKVTNDIHIRLPELKFQKIRCLSVSRDFSHIFVFAGSPSSSNLLVLDSSRKKHVGGINIDHCLRFAQLTPDGCEIQAQRVRPHGIMRWKIVKGRKSGSVELESLAELPLTPPWESSLGYEVMDKCWVLSPTKERLLWLPHQWREAGYAHSASEGRRWSGQFLGLGYCELSEVVILEFLK